MRVCGVGGGRMSLCVLCVVVGLCEFLCECAWVCASLHVLFVSLCVCFFHSGVDNVDPDLALRAQP